MDYKLYEQHKAAIKELNLSPAEYETAIKELVKELENDTSTKSI